MLITNEAKVLDAISTAISSYGIAPTMQEVSDTTGLSFGGVQKIIARLEYRGFIRRQFRGHRAMQVLKLPDQEKTAA